MASEPDPGTRSRSVLNRIVAGLGIVTALGIVWLVAYWIAGIHAHRELATRSKVSEIALAAASCRTTVAQYYASRKRMPANETDAGCGPATANVTAPSVVEGVVTARARGKLEQELVGAGSGISIVYKPACDGPCVGDAVARWECKSATTIETRFRPPSCR